LAFRAAGCAIARAGLGPIGVDLPGLCVFPLIIRLTRPDVNGPWRRR
jgi:hypothetical protein